MNIVFRDAILKSSLGSFLHIYAGGEEISPERWWTTGKVVIIYGETIQVHWTEREPC
jgi:hypothetical protein